MIQEKKHLHASLLIIGAGPAGLAAAIAAKSANKDTDIVVIEKSESLGNHTLSGALLEIGSLKRLLDNAYPNWQRIEGAHHITQRHVSACDIYYLLDKNAALKMTPMIKLGKKAGLSLGEMDTTGNYIISINQLTKFLGKIALSLGVEICTGFGVKEILLNQAKIKVSGVKLVDQGLDKSGKLQPNYLSGETITADIIILAEGTDGLVTESLVAKAGLKRGINQVYSIGIKEIIKVNKERYALFGNNRAIHTIGYPLWSPTGSPNIFGGGFAYSYGDNLITVGIIAGADWKYCNFNPQKALQDLKRHTFIQKFIEGGEIIEAGVKMIPEGGFYALPRYIQSNSNGKAIAPIGFKNALIIGDSAGFVNMHKIKGLHNAIESGTLAGKASTQCLNIPEKAAQAYTQLLEESPVMAEMKSAKNFRALIARCGLTVGFPLSLIGKYLPEITIEKDYKAMTHDKFTYDTSAKFDKMTFISLAGTKHREDQPSHLSILDQSLCIKKCASLFERPCITFCPAGVYEQAGNETHPANPSNCIHCKTCQRKCPFDNIRWTVPEGGGGPRYKQM